MRHDRERLTFEIRARDGAARTGRLRTAHADVDTPAFIPLATRGAVKALTAAEVAELGYQLVLGNTFHLMLSPGAERIAGLGGLHRFMGWDRAIITDSGGFQVFSLAHGGVADEIKGRRGAPAGSGSILEIAEEGVRFRSYVDGSEQLLSPEASMGVQAALGSDVALAFDECTPYHVDREYTARSTERTHRWLDRCLDWHSVQGPSEQAIFGIVQGGIHEDLRRESAERVSSAGVDGLAIGGTLGRDRDEMAGVLAATLPHLPPEAAKHLLGIGEVDNLLDGVAQGIDLFDCAAPTRLGRHGMALVPLPGERFRINLRQSRWASDPAPVLDGCSCPACRSHSRAYLHYLVRARELTAVRLLTMHNLHYVGELMRGARNAIAGGRYGAYRDAVLSGSVPWEV